MAYKLRNLWVNGVPPAPLIGERLSAIDFDFMKTKAALRKEIPYMTISQLMAGERIPVDTITGQMVIAGFFDSAAEIRELVRQDLKEREDVLAGRGCIIPTNQESKKSKQIPPLGRNTKKLKMLSEVFCELELLMESEQWKMVIVSRLELAEALIKVDIWLASRIVQSCFRFISNLDESIPEDRVIISEIHLIKAFFSFKADPVNQNELQYNLQQCLQLIGDHKDKKMYSIMHTKDIPKRQGVIRIVIERPVALHGWQNYGKVVAVQEIVTLKNTSLYQMGCIMACLNQLNCAKMQEIDRVKHTRSRGSSSGSHSGENDPAAEDDEDHFDIVKLQQQTFSDAIAFAKEGENASCILQAIFTCGAYMMRHKLYDEAGYVFHKLRHQSKHFNDQETLGITCNRLGAISKCNHKIQHAMNYYEEEWNIGKDLNLPILRIDALLDFGILLLEEGQIMEAATMSWLAYQELNDVITQITSSSSPVSPPSSTSYKNSYKSVIDPEKEFKNMKKYDFKDDDNMYLKIWAWTGLIAGHSNWPRLAGNCRIKKLSPVAAWKISRHHLHAVWHPPATQRPVTISSCKKHYDIKRLTKKMGLTDDDQSKDLDEDAQGLEKTHDQSFNYVQDQLIIKSQQKLSTSISEESGDKDVVAVSSEMVYEIEDGEHDEEQEDEDEEKEQDEDQDEEQEEMEYSSNEEVEEIETDHPRVSTWELDITATLEEIYTRQLARAEMEFNSEMSIRIKLRESSTSTIAINLNNESVQSLEEDASDRPQFGEEESKMHLKNAWESKVEAFDYETLSEGGSEDGSEEDSDEEEEWNQNVDEVDTDVLEATEEEDGTEELQEIFSYSSSISISKDEND